MYSTKHIETSTDVAMENICLTNHVLHEENKTVPMVQDNKEGIIKIILNNITNISGNLSKLHTSFISRMNNPLSVTLVDHQNLLTSEFLENSLRKTESLNMEKKCNVFFETRKPRTFGTFDQASSNCIKIDPYNSDSNNTIRNIQQDYENVIENFTHPEFQMMYKNNNIMETCPPLYTPDLKILNNIMNNSCTMEINTQEYMDNDKDMLNEKKNSISNDVDNEDMSVDIRSYFIVDNSDVPPKLDYVQKIDTSMSARLTDICLKMWSDMTNRLCCKMEFSLCKLEIHMNHSYQFSSPSKQRKKANTFVVGRGKGRSRAKCQHRRSGVCQTRYRKKQSKHHTTVNIQDTILEDLEVYHAVQNDYSLSNSNSSGDINQYDVLDTAGVIRRISSSPVIFTFLDIKSSEEKSKAHDNGNRLNSKVKQETVKCLTKTCISDSLTDIHRSYNSEFDENALRLRLLSESSVDSEDSYCIVFEDGSDAINAIDIADYDETSYENENSDDDEKSRPQKVKFNLIPNVYTMIKWDYAYRAARKGPWEEMARDRERFKRRINCIAAVLNPILASQHRALVWQKRFIFQE